ncbi:hypothetical protein [Bradyrhizobium sp. NBAIM08]|uniref:hypothetical protein n=1 Tax=Bradyrhizobium sp. NBAIM08 TaxID=2793815 RepID=UPI001CD259F8|nr:hypothetical protein [Bradyrhizobium sp. NBAIM08]MCA1479824.1 hypothetical protein [Bradyrhizobium sp. NBAIM08]
MPGVIVVRSTSTLKWADIQERRREGHIFFENRVLTVAWLSRPDVRRGITGAPAFMLGFFVFGERSPPIQDAFGAA